MAGAGTKRIVDLTETSEVQNGDYLAIDSTARGTKKTPVSVFATAADLTAEQTARAAADTTLDGKITAEAQARANAIGAEQTAREEADDALTESVTALSDEVTAQGALIQNPTKTVSGAIAHFTDGADMPAKSVVVNIEPKQSGTGTPSPDNVRQISGWESVNLYGRGKNLIDAVNLSPTSSARWVNTDGVAVKSNVQYTLSAKASKSLSNRVYVVFTDKATITQSETASGKTFLTAQFVNSDTLTFTFTANNDAYIYLYIGDVVGDFTLSDVQIETGTTATAYEPYTGTTTPVNLGRTVYGGTLDVVSGLLTVDRAMVDLGSLNWGYSAYNIFYVVKNDIKPVSGGGSSIANLICSIYEADSSDNIYDHKHDGAIGYHNGLHQLWVNDSRYTSAADFKSAMNGVQLVYELATPQTYQLTSTEVKTLLGENNVWADAGAVSVTYRRDINLALEQLEALLNS